MTSKSPAAVFTRSAEKPSPFTLCLALLAVSGGAAMNTSLNATGEEIRLDFNIAPSQLAVLDAVPIATFAAFSLIAGLLADRRAGARVLMVTAGLALSFVAQWNFALASTLRELQVFRFLGGVGWGLVLAPAISLVASSVSERARPAALGALGLVLLLTPVAMHQLLILLDEGWRMLGMRAGLGVAGLAAILLLAGRDRRPPRKAWKRGDYLFLLLLVLACVAHGLLIGTLNSGALTAPALGELTWPQVNLVASGAGALAVGVLASSIRAGLSRLLWIFAACSILAGAGLLAATLAGAARVSPEILLAAASAAGGGWFGVAYSAGIIGGGTSRGSTSAATLAVAAGLASVAAAPLKTLVSAQVGERAANLAWPALGLVTFLLILLAFARRPGRTPDAGASTGADSYATLLGRAGAQPSAPGVALRGFGISTGENILIALVALLIVGLLGLATLQAGTFESMEAGAGVAMFLLFLSPWVFVMWRGYRRLRRKSKTQQQADLTALDDDFVLYLRPFRFDLRSDVTADAFGYKGPVTPGTPFEEALGALCLDAGLGIKSVGPVEGQFGLSAIYTDDAGWQKVVGQLMDRAKLIIIIPGPGAGCTWEIAQLASRADLANKTIWVMPPAAVTGASVKIAELWTEMDAAAFPSAPPAYRREGALFCYRIRADRPAAGETAPFSLNLIGQAVTLAARDLEAKTVRTHGR